MKMVDLLSEMENLKIGARLKIYHASDDSVFIIKRPEREVHTLKRKPTLEKNIQIWVKEKEKESFMPNHLRIFIDLEFKRTAKPELREPLLLIFDGIYYGSDPTDVSREFKDIVFPRPLRPLDYDLFLTQLFLAEQTVNYVFESNFDPKCLYLQGWIRCVLEGRNEIDRLCWGATRHPPSIKYTKQDNKKHKEYNSTRKKLWYLEE